MLRYNNDVLHTFDIQIRVSAKEHSAKCEIAGSHTNVIRLEKEGVPYVSRAYEEERESADIDQTDHELLTAIVTDRGIIYPPFDVNLKRLFEA